MKKKIKRFFKWLGISLAVIILLMILLPFIFKKQIIEAVKAEINKNLNAEVNFSDYSLNLFTSFPNFNLGLDQLSITGIEDFKDDTLASVKKLSVSINLFSVFGGDAYEIRTIRILEPRINMIMLGNGKANWDIVKSAPADTTQADGKEETNKFRLKLKKLLIKKANISFEDKLTGMMLKVSDLNHTLKGDLSADYTELFTQTFISKATFRHNGIHYLSDNTISLKINIAADLKNSKYSFLDNEIKVNELAVKIEGWVAILKDGLDLDLKLSVPKTEFKHVLSLIPAIYLKDFNKVKTSGTFNLDGMVKGKYAEKLMPAFQINFGVQQASFQYPELPKAISDINIKAQISNKGGDPDHTVINVEKLHFAIGKDVVDARIHVSTPVSDPSFDIFAKGKFDLSGVKDFYPLKAGQNLSGLIDLNLDISGKMSDADQGRYENIKASGAVLITGLSYKSDDFKDGILISEAGLMFTPRELQLQSLKVKFGKSNFSASGKADNYLAYIFRGELLKGSFDLDADFVNLNDFMSAEKEVKATETKEPEEKSDMSVILVPGNIDFVLNANIGKLVYDKMEMDRINGNIGLKDHVLNLNNLSMNFLGGSITLKGSYSTANPEVPKADLNLSISRIQIADALKHFRFFGKFAPIAKNAQGAVSLNISYTSDLKKNMTLDYSTISASGSLQTYELIIKNNPVFEQLCEKIKVNIFKWFAPLDLKISFEIKNGTITIEPFDFKVRKTTGRAQGFFKLDNSLHIILEMAITRDEFGEHSKKFLEGLSNDAKNLGVPVDMDNVVRLVVVISGKTPKPQIKVGLKGTMDDVFDNLKEKLKEELEKKKEEIITNVKEGVNNAIDEAEKKARQIIDEAEAKARQIRDEAKAAGDKLISEADAQGQKLIKDAGNPIAKEAAKVTAKQLKKEAEDQAAKLNNEAGKKADDVVNKARAEAEKVKKEAREKTK